MMFNVPPTELMANFEAPKPRCTCMVLTASPRPAQFDQYTQPFSMSLTGIPLIKTATLRWSNPRMLMRLSPKPPPLLVAYTPGVMFNVSTNSLSPNCS